MSTVPPGAPPPPPPNQIAFQIGLGYMTSAALNVALELEIPDRLAAGPQRVSDLARDAGVNEDGLYRVLRALASVGVFEERDARTFALNPTADLMRKGETTLRDILLFLTDRFHFRVYAELMHSVVTGQPALEKVTGFKAFEYFASDPDENERFNNGMTSMSAAVIPAVLKAYDFGGIERLVDVAGGHGMVLASVLRQYPRMRGVLFDLDHVVAGAPPLLDRAGVRDRCEVQAGDFFAAVPSGGDAYIMKNIIHDWDDDRAVTILKNIAGVLRDRRDGKVILLEMVLQPGNAPDLGKVGDLEMLVMPGGRERTADEFKTLFARAGFELTRVVPTESPMCVVEARLGRPQASGPTPQG